MTRTHRAMKITEDWRPSDETVEYTGRVFPSVDHVRSWRRFVDYHRSRGDKSESWDAAFTLWVEQDADKITDHREGGTDFMGVPNDTAMDWRNLLMGRNQGTGDSQ